MGRDLERLQEWHFALMSLLLAGRSQADAAIALGRQQTAISLVVNSPQFQHELAKRRARVDEVIARETGVAAADARDILAENAALAASKVVELMVESEDEKIQLSAASQILDRVYGKGAQPNQVTIVSGENVNVLIQALSESGGMKLAGALVERTGSGDAEGVVSVATAPELEPTELPIPERSEDGAESEAA